MPEWPPFSQLIASSSSLGLFSIKIDANGNLGVFLGSTELFHVTNNTLVTDSVGLTVGTGFGVRFGPTAGGRSTGSFMAAYTGLQTLGLGVAFFLGLDNRSGVTAADGSPITLYAVPVGANQLFRASIEIDATAFTSGTATYTLTWTENGVAQTAVVTATAINIVTGIVRLMMPDASTNITIQLTGAFVATLRLSGVVEQIA